MRGHVLVRASHGVAEAPVCRRVAEYGHMRIALVTMAVLLATAPMAANWPQWRGPSGLGVSAEVALPTTWSERDIHQP